MDEARRLTRRLVALRRGDVAQALRELRAQRLELQAIHLNVALRGRWATALRRLAALEAPTAVSFNAVLSRCGWRQGLRLLRCMRHRALEPSVASYVGCKAPWPVASELLRDMRRRGLRRDVKLTGHGSWAALLGAVLQLRQGNVEPDVVNYGLLLREAPGWRLALALLRELRSQLRANVVVVDAALGATDWRRSLLAVQGAVAEGIAVDKCCADGAVRASARGLQWRKALQMRWEKADGLTWSAVMSSWQGTGILLEARRSAVELDLHMASAAVAAWPHAAELLRCCEAAALRSDSTMLAAVQGSGLKALGWSEALGLNVKARQMDLDLDLLGLPFWESSLHRLAKGPLETQLLRTHDAMSVCPWPLALSLLLSLSCLRLNGSVMTSNCVVAACGKSRQWLQAVRHFAAMEELDDISFNSLLGALERTGKWQLALALLERMASCQLALDEFSYNAAINVCKYAVRRASAWSKRR